jgi:hypothetical protein
MPWCVMSVFGTILAKGREHDAVLEGDAAEGQWLEEFGDGLAIGLGIGGCACRGYLCGGVVGNLIPVSTCIYRVVRE